MPTYQELTHNTANSVTGGIWRVTGGPHGNAVLKICTPNGAGAWEVGNHRPHWNYWRREVFAYETGLTTAAYGGAGIVGPKLLALDERDDGSVGLWLEDVAGVPGFDWTVDALADFARRLGSAQAYWTTTRLPNHPWLSRRWLGQYVNRNVRPGAIPWDHPTASAAWPAKLRNGVRAIWEGRSSFIAAVENAQQTLCHLDVWPMNLIDDANRVVLLDWAFVGHGAVGEDPANLVIDSVADGRMPIELLPEIDAAVTDGYVAGLRDGGVATEHDQIRRTIAAAGVAKYCWLAPMMLQRLATAGSVGSASYDVDPTDTVGILERRRILFEHLVTLAGAVTTATTP